MLMLTRKKNEALIIDLGGQVIKIQVTRLGVGTKSGKKEVQLGVDAPGEYRVWRAELYDAMEENRRAAASRNSRPAQLLNLFTRK